MVSELLKIPNIREKISKLLKDNPSLKLSSDIHKKIFSNNQKLTNTSNKNKDNSQSFNFEGNYSITAPSNNKFKAQYLSFGSKNTLKVTDECDNYFSSEYNAY